MKIPSEPHYPETTCNNLVAILMSNSTNTHIHTHTSAWAFSQAKHQVIIMTNTTLFIQFSIRNYEDPFNLPTRSNEFHHFTTCGYSTSCMCLQNLSGLSRSTSSFFWPRSTSAEPRF